MTQTFGTVVFGFGVGAALLVSAAVLAWLSTWIIRENESGLVVKKFGPALPAGQIVALRGEAGYQARLLSPGWHVGLWRWRYRVVRVPMVVVPQFCRLRAKRCTPLSASACCSA